MKDHRIVLIIITDFLVILIQVFIRIFIGDLQILSLRNLL
jgi:hypothetical protein